MDSTVKTQLEGLLRQIQLLMPASERSSTELNRIFKAICNLVFDKAAYHWLWDEPVLSQLDWLFQLKSPEPTMFGAQMTEIRERVELSRKANDLFFRILNPDCSAESVIEALGALSSTDPSLLPTLKSSGRLETIREVDTLPSGKISTFLDFLSEDIGLNLTNREPIDGCLEALRAREGAGVVNTLLVRTSGESALVMPLQIKVQSGNGQVHHLVHGRKDFEAALKRARLALLGQAFLKNSDDIICTLDLTQPEYLGTSIGLGAAVGMYGATRRMVIDPYTAFTGDINLDREQHWRIKSVSGLPQKLKAAVLGGIRRVFIPKENMSEVNGSLDKNLQIIPVDEILAVFLKLQVSTQPLLGDSLQVRKIDVLNAYCQARGWDLSPSEQIQYGLQFNVAPLAIPKISINIFDTGTHTPKQHDRLEYQELLKTLGEIEESEIPLRKVEQSLNIQDSSLRAEIREALEGCHPSEERKESHCDYAFTFTQGKERLVLKQYSKGTLQIQGTAGKLYKTILECMIPRYNIHHPAAQLSVETFLHTKEGAGITKPFFPVSSMDIREIPLPHIGTDESGKGDYFGPMVVAGVLIDAQTKPKLEALGVKDSKLLSDKRCRELAAKIREICKGKYEEVEIPPERYNDLYESFRKEGKNLNHLLAWGHARAIETLLERQSCTHAVADQFGDEHYIRSSLMEKGKHIQLIQLPKGERYLAVAAASVLTRDKFLARLEKLGQGYGIDLPKGASDTVITAAKRIVERKGSGELRKIAKLHHKTTHKILEDG